jgi:hypothetical protein
VVTDDVLNSPMLPVLVALELTGVRFRLDGDRVLVSPSGVLTPEQRAMFHANQAVVRLLVAVATDVGVHDRRDVFRRQHAATPTGTLPFFQFRRGVPYTRGACFSCGDQLPDVRFGRCWRCSLAWRLACRLPVGTDLAGALDTARVA